MFGIESGAPLRDDSLLSESPTGNPRRDLAVEMARSDPAPSPTDPTDGPHAPRPSRQYGPNGIYHPYRMGHPLYRPQPGAAFHFYGSHSFPERYGSHPLRDSETPRETTADSVPEPEPARHYEFPPASLSSEERIPLRTATPHSDSAPARAPSTAPERPVTPSLGIDARLRSFVHSLDPDARPPRPRTDSSAHPFDAELEHRVQRLAVRVSDLREGVAERRRSRSQGPAPRSECVSCSPSKIDNRDIPHVSRKTSVTPYQSQPRHSTVVLGNAFPTPLLASGTLSHVTYPTTHHLHQPADLQISPSLSIPRRSASYYSYSAGSTKSSSWSPWSVPPYSSHRSRSLPSSPAFPSANNYLAELEPLRDPASRRSSSTVPPTTPSILAVEEPLRALQALVDDLSFRRTRRLSASPLAPEL